MKKNLKSIDLHLIANLILSVIVLIMGIIIMVFNRFGLTDIILYVSVLYYTYAFFSLIAYFVKRREGDYELLLLSLINVIAATYMFVFQSSNLPMILGSGMLVYTILMIANRGYKVFMLKSQNNYIWAIKFIITFLLAFIGILTTVNLFTEKTVQTMLMGYYFITNGLLMTLESGIELFVTDHLFNKIVSKLVDEEEQQLEEVKEETIVAPIIEKKTTKKTVAKKTEKETTKKTEKNKVTKENKKNETKAEDKVIAVATPKKTTKKSVETKESNVTKKVGRPKKEAAIKESKKSEIKIVEKKKATPKAKKEVVSTKSESKPETKVKATAKTKKVAASEANKETSNKKTVVKKETVKESKKETAKKTTTTKKAAKETTRKPGRPKKESSK